MVTSGQEAEQPITEEDRKTSYGYIADVLEGVRPNGCGGLSAGATRAVIRFVAVLRATAAVSPLTVAAPLPMPQQPMTAEPVLASPVVAALAVAKVNGSH